MAKKSKKKPKSGKKAAKDKVPEAAPGDVWDDPGPTRALTAAEADDEAEDAAEGDVWDDPGPTRALTAAEADHEAEEADAGDVHDDPGPTRTLPLAKGEEWEEQPTRQVPPAEVLDEIETVQALDRISEVKTEKVKKAPKKKR